MSRSTISGCSANGEGSTGGGIRNDGTLELSGGSITGCSANEGGGIYSTDRTKLNKTEITGNSSSQCGGGIAYQGSFELMNSITITGNTMNGAACDV